VKFLNIVASATVVVRAKDVDVIAIIAIIVVHVHSVAFNPI
jgi:hypothetical protein